MPMLLLSRGASWPLQRTSCGVHGRDERGARNETACFGWTAGRDPPEVFAFAFAFAAVPPSLGCDGDVANSARCCHVNFTSPPSVSVARQRGKTAAETAPFGPGFARSMFLGASVKHKDLRGRGVAHHARRDRYTVALQQNERARPQMSGPTMKAKRNMGLSEKDRLR
ncbi:hypothetical protein BKA80DRAFT_271920 [Phyllosticta citrichinensis]